MRIMLIPALLLVTLALTAQANIAGYITATDQRKLLEAVTKSFIKLQDGDVITLYYGAKGFSLLNKPIVTVILKDSCAHLEHQLKKTPTPEEAFHALSSWSLLKCENGKLHSETTITTLKAVLESSESTSADIRYAVEALHVIGQTIPNPAKVSQLLQTKLKADDSLLSIGHAMHASVFLGTHGKFATDRIEEVLAQIDEVDTPSEPLAQWEGGLTTTSHLITALLRLPATATSTHLTPTLVDKLATYLLTRRTVQTPRGALALLEAALALAGSGAALAPVSVTAAGWATGGVWQVRVCDLMGEVVKGSGAVTVMAQSATRVVDDVVVLSKQPLTAGKTPTDYTLPLQLDPGHYRLVLTVNQRRPTTLTLRLAGPVTFTSTPHITLTLEDTDGTATVPSATHKLTHPSGKVPAGGLNADGGQQLVLRFALSRPVHQTFLRLVSVANGKEIVFVAEREGGGSGKGSYKVAVSLATELVESGAYEMELILGDSIMSNPIRWNLGQIDVTLPSSSTPATTKASTKSLRPEIEHLFRQAEKRPPQVVSMFFSGLVALPLLILLGLWAKLGVNVKNFSAVAIPFHLGLAAILGLFVCFWLKLDMFTTCAWLVPIGAFTFLSGNMLLSSIGRQRTGGK